MGSINRKITTIFKFCITRLHYLSSLGTFQALSLWLFCNTWHNSHRNFDCSDVLTYNGYFNSSSMRQLNFLTFIDNLKTFFFFNLASWFKGWGDFIDHSLDLIRFLFHLARTCSITTRQVAIFGLPSTLFSNAHRRKFSLWAFIDLIFQLKEYIFWLFTANLRFVLNRHMNYYRHIIIIYYYSIFDISV